MISIFDFREYSPFLRAYLKNQPKNGHGVLSRWADELRISTTLISLIVSGKKPLSLDLAVGLAAILGLAEKETDYFMLLSDWERAGSKLLRDILSKKIEVAQSASRLLKNRIEKANQLEGEALAKYYSSWIYAGIRNLISTDPKMSVETLASRLAIPRARASDALEFLLQQNLVAREGGGIQLGSRVIYLSSDSALVNKHHHNWRIKGMQKMDSRDEREMFFTLPMSLSNEAATQLRKNLVDMIQELRKIALDSESETVRCLNIDWFEF